MSDAHAHHQHEIDTTDVFGFWMYILTDCILFASLFATFLVLNYPVAYGPSLKKHIDLYYVLWETFLLLGSNFTFCCAFLSFNKNRLAWVQFFLGVTFLLGAGFVAMEIHEFIHLMHHGYHYNASGGASAFFTLVGTHGFHVSVGLLWILVMMVQLPTLKMNSITKKRFTYLGLFWNFLDIVWIFLFTIVYLMGAL